MKLLLTWVLRLLLGWLVVTLSLVMVLRWVAPPVTMLMAQRTYSASQARQATLNTYEWVPLRQIPKSLQRAAVMAEDPSFYRHWGYPRVVKTQSRVRGLQLKKPQRPSITQQVAATVFAGQGRHWLRGGLQAYFTLLLEVCWSKDRILEMYLNTAEMGRGIYGVQAASQHHFGRGVGRLSALQGALLVAALPNPRTWNPAQPDEYLRSRSRWLIKKVDQEWQAATH